MSTVQVMVTITCDDLTEDEWDLLPQWIWDFIGQSPFVDAPTARTSADLAAALFKDQIEQIEYSGSILGDDAWEAIGHPRIEVR